jgi:hypothetical protein
LSFSGRYSSLANIDIVKFDECKETGKKRHKQEWIKKLTAMRKIFECTKCALKCSLCGTQVDIAQTSSHAKGVPYRFCMSCEEEFRHFLDRTKGLSGKDLYWHNREWMEMWRTWMHYQDAMRTYENSREFKRLLNDLRRELE